MKGLDLPQHPLWGCMRGLLNAIDGVAQIGENEEFSLQKFLWSPLWTGIIYYVLDQFFPNDSVWLKLSAASTIEALLKSMGRIKSKSIK